MNTPSPTAPTYRIAPSILSADFARLGEEVRNVIAAGADSVAVYVLIAHTSPTETQFQIIEYVLILHKRFFRYTPCSRY
jgi:pentose-5-phosphate-3-epimerase